MQAQAVERDLEEAALKVRVEVFPWGFPMANSGRIGRMKTFKRNLQMYGFDRSANSDCCQEID